MSRWVALKDRLPGIYRHWQITGTRGHIMADGAGYLLYAKAGKSAKRWNNVKKALSFACVSGSCALS
jgi:hypothetical protein